MPEFEWDPEKSLANEEKHGVSFFTAIQIWEGPHVTVDRIAYSKQGETRNATIGFIGNQLFTAISTDRNGVTRLISVRRARDGEEKVFWEKAV